MNANGFREEELVSRRVKVGNEWQIKIFPIVAGRLRLAHEENQSLSLQTELVNWDGQYAVFKCCAVTGKGQFIGYGTANNQRDERLAESLVELAETRSIARALRFAGYGMEYTGAEEVSHVGATEAEKNKLVAKPLHQCSLRAMATAKWKNQNRQVTALISPPLEQPKRQVALRLQQDQNRNLAA